jgi:hypothetical protein
MKKVLKKSFLLIALSLFLLPDVAKSEINAEFQNVVRVDANTLFREYRENEAAANQRYRGQIVEVTGVVHNVRSSINPETRREEYVVSLVVNPLMGHFVELFFLVRDRSQIVGLEQGQSVTIRGLGAGMGINRVTPALINSSVVSVGLTRAEQQVEAARVREQQEREREIIAEQRRREREIEEQARREREEVARIERERIQEEEERRAEEEERRAEEEYRQQQEDIARWQRELNTSVEGVVINGIRWATRNVDRPGTFAATPESTGLLYFRDRTNLGSLRSLRWRVAGQNNRRANPCPRGWRVPTIEELQSLFYNTDIVWVERNGVNGVLFGNAPYLIFLPASGSFFGPGDFDNVAPGLRGRYWGSGNENSIIEFNENGVSIRGRISGLFSGAHSIRCVAE